jgi:Ca-activated chloride channel family protein
MFALTFVLFGYNSAQRNRARNMKLRTVTITVLISTLAFYLQAGQSTPAAPPQKNQNTVRVDVDLTLVNATVLETVRGRVVTDLKPEHFEVWEDRVQQEISYFSEEDMPISLGIIFDISGSMKEKLSIARDAAVDFLQTGNPDDEYFLVEFSSRPEVSQDFTTDISRLRNHLMFVPADGRTALYDAVYVGLRKLQEGAHPKKALLLITDGEDNRSRYSFNDVRDFIKEQDVELFAIGIVGDYNSSLANGRTGRAIIEELTDLTGGRAFFPDSIYELPDICTKIAVELKNQYLIGYKSTNGTKDGKWRRISLKVHPPEGMPDMIVRGKQGYYAPTTGK